MLLGIFLLCDDRYCSSMTSVCVIHVKPRKEHGAKNDDSPYSSYCSTKVKTLVEYMESGESNLLS